MSDETKSLTQSAERWLSLAALVVAPTSLITGLCYFFGLLFIRSKLQYFGVDPSTLGYTSADYAVTTVGLFFFAALRVLIVLAVLVVLGVAFRHWAATGRRITLLRTIAWLFAGFGAVSLTVAVVWLASERNLIKWIVDNPTQMHMAVAIAAGITLPATGYWTLTLTGLGRLPKIAERALLVLAATGLVVALFWVTDLYAVDQGKGHGAFASTQLWAADGDYTAVQLDTLRSGAGQMVTGTGLLHHRDARRDTPHHRRGERDSRRERTQYRPVLAMPRSRTYFRAARPRTHSARTRGRTDDRRCRQPEGHRPGHQLRCRACHR
ncbi:hypothetical protein [Mycobacterium sp. DL99]|uniref:hypothetical protein n=1 Tax=Mycobacterium sp. DL99 TaxID=2528957 RepID=UPI0025709D80|nr:hypothetical protein [Mycobacterium sp. DL99]